MSRAVRMLLTGALAALGVGAAAGPASARRSGREIPSGRRTRSPRSSTRGRHRFWFTTGSGKIFKRIGGTLRRRSRRPSRRSSATSSSSRAATSASPSARTAPSIAATNAGSTWSPVAVLSAVAPAERDTTATSAVQPLGDVDVGPLRGDGTRAWLAAGGSQIARSQRHEPDASDRAWSDANRSGHGRLQDRRRTSTTCSSVPGGDVGLLRLEVLRRGLLLHRTTSASTAQDEAAASAGNGFQHAAARSPATRRTRTGSGPSPRAAVAAPTTARTETGWSNADDWAIANPDERAPWTAPTTSTTPAARSSRPVTRG